MEENYPDRKKNYVHIHGEHGMVFKQDCYKNTIGYPILKTPIRYTMLTTLLMTALTTTTK